MTMPSGMRTGWICSRCQASVSPDERTCPACSVAAPVVVPIDLTPRSSQQPWAPLRPPNTTPIYVTS